MKRLCLLFFLLAISFASRANLPARLVSIYGDFSVYLPLLNGTLISTNENGTLFYALEDTVNEVSYQVFRIDSMNFNAQFPNYNLTDADFYALIPQSLIYYFAEDSITLEEWRQISLPSGSSSIGRKIGISLLQENGRLFIFLECFLVNGKLYIFSISGNEEQLGTLLVKEDSFFESLSVGY